MSAATPSSNGPLPSPILPAYENWPARRIGTIERLFPGAAAKLIVVPETTTVRTASAKFVTGVDMIVVCGPDGGVVGVLTKSDLLSHLSGREPVGQTVAVSAAMTRDVIRCSRTDRIGAVWMTMHERSLRTLPVTCPQLRPLGLVTARDALEAMLEEAEVEDLMMRDYIMGVGYR